MLEAGFSQVARSIRAAALYVLLTLLFSNAIEFNSCTTKADSGKLAPETKPSKKDGSTKTKKQPKEADMQNLKTLTMRIKVGGSKVVLALAGFAASALNQRAGAVSFTALGAPRCCRATE